MFNIKKIAATAAMALVIGGGLIGGSIQATTASASGGSEPITTEASGYDGIKCEDDECLRLTTLTTFKESSMIYRYMPVLTFSVLINNENVFTTNEP